MERLKIFLLIFVLVFISSPSRAEVPTVTINSIEPSAINNEGEATIKWEADQGSDCTYDIEVGGGSKGSGNKIFDGSGSYNAANKVVSNKISADDLPTEDISPEEEYYTVDYTIYVYVTCPGSEEGSQETGSGNITLTLDTLPPPPPSWLEVLSGDSKLFLTWGYSEGTDTEVSNHIVYYDTESRSTSDEYEYSVDAGDGLEYSLTGLINGIPYYVRIGAVDIAQNKSIELSEEKSGMPQDVVGYEALVDEEGGCFIATASFGNEDSWHVSVFRRTRDRCLLPHSFGRRIVSIYYVLSPEIASKIEHNKAIKTTLKAALTPLAGLCWVYLETSLWQKIIILLIFLIIPILIFHKKFLLNKFFIIILIILTFPSHSGALSLSPSFIEIKGGVFLPEQSEFRKFYQTTRSGTYHLSAGWNLHKTVRIMGTVGYLLESGKGIVSSTVNQEEWVRSNERFLLHLVPAQGSIFYQFNYFDQQLLIPYIGAGLDFYYAHTRLEDGTDKMDTWKRGYHGSLGILFLLDAVDPFHAGKIESDFGIKNTYLVLETHYSKIDNFGQKKGYDFSGFNVLTGIAFGF